MSYNYYDNIVKWCSLINCNGCVSLDIAYILALSSITKRKKTCDYYLQFSFELTNSANVHL